MARLHTPVGPAENMAAAEGPGAVPLASFWWTAYAAVVATLLALLLALTGVFLAKEERLVDRHLSVLAEILTHELASRTAAVRVQLGRWRDDPVLQEVLEDGGPALRRAKEEELALLIPGATGVVLLTAEDVAPGGGAADRLSYAGVDMVRRVNETQAISPLEAHRVRQDDEHLAIAGPVMDASGERLLGVVHLMLPLSLLPAAGDAAAHSARFRFGQRTDQRFVDVNSKVDGMSPSEPPNTQTPVQGTRLVLRAWGSAERSMVRELVPWLIASFATALALLALSLWLPYRRQRLGIEADLAIINALAEDAANRRPPRSARTRIHEFRPIHDTLRRVMRDLPSPRAVMPRSEAELAALAGPAEPEETMELEFEQGLELEDEPSAPTDTAAPRSAVAPLQPGVAEQVPPRADVPAGGEDIFRAYDIRGLIGSQITPEVMHQLGLAVAGETRDRGELSCVVARDQRPSGESLANALVEGLRAGGIDVIDLGVAPTPVVYFATQLHSGCSAAVVTASHNPAQYNGLKVVLAGRSATSDEIGALRERVQGEQFSQGEGDYAQADVLDEYVAEIERDVAVARPLKIVVDCGHATASLVAGQLYRALDCEVIELDCDLEPALADERMPDPSQPRNLEALGEAVLSAGADLGLAFDADGDRLGVVDSQGRFVDVDQVLMLLAADVLARLPGSDIVYDVKCSHHLGAEIVRNGGRPVMWRSGHAHLKEKMRELGAPLGGELSGHIVFTERWNGFDDAFYAAARLLEVLALDPRSSSEVFAELPSATGTPELFLPVDGSAVRDLMQNVLGMADRLDGVEVNTIDGLRAEFDHGWGLVRASNTQPGLVFRFQADDDESLSKIQDLFRRMMELVAPEIELPF